MPGPAITGFNPRAHAGRDPGLISIAMRIGRFQSTRPRGARRKNPAFAGVPNPFQSTRPRGARRKNPAFAGVPNPFQSTRPRGARPFPSVYARPRKCVSIHAPTRGATRLNPATVRPLIVSIHAPTRGATMMILYNRRDICFNPRAHAGRDPDFAGRKNH